jgi:hypothetical protein
MIQLGSLLDYDCVEEIVLLLYKLLCIFFLPVESKKEKEANLYIPFSCLKSLNKLSVIRS